MSDSSPTSHIPSIWDEPMALALAEAVSADAPLGPNPRVGCLLLNERGEVVGRGHHRGAGTAHAEVDAISDAGPRARGATAVVTLEPCRHMGRTGPCTTALVEAGVVRVVYGQADPTLIAGGGAEILTRAGVEVVGPLFEVGADTVNRGWSHVQLTGRPLVTLKCAVSLDGRVADATGGPTIITGPVARAWVGQLRSEVGAVLVGTNTVLVDNPALTARGVNQELLTRQPLRAAMGLRALPPESRFLEGADPGIHLWTRDPVAALGTLLEHGVQHVLIEGGPSLAASFLEAGLVDEVIWFLAPVLFGTGPVSMPPLSRAHGVDVTEVRVIGHDVLIRGFIHGFIRGAIVPM